MIGFAEKVLAYPAGLELDRSSRGRRTCNAAVRKWAVPRCAAQQAQRTGDARRRQGQSIRCFPAGRESGPGGVGSRLRAVPLFTFLIYTSGSWQDRFAWNFPEAIAKIWHRFFLALEKRKCLNTSLYIWLDIGGSLEVSELMKMPA